MLRKMTVLAAALIIGSTSAALAAKQNFTLVNKTGYTINEVYVSAASTSEWEEDVMGADALVNNDSVRIQFTGQGNTCKYDLKVVYDDGEEAVWDGFNLCSTSKITVKYNRNTGETSAEYQ